MRFSQSIRGLVGLAALALVPSLACKTELDADAQRSFAAAGLQLRETRLVRGADGTWMDRRHAGSREERTTLSGRERSSQRTQVVRRTGFQPHTLEAPEIVLFDGAEQAASFLASHGIGDPEEPGEGDPGFGFTGGAGWLTPPAAGGGSLVFGARDPAEPADGGAELVAIGGGSGQLVSSGGGGDGGLGAADDYATIGDGPDFGGPGGLSGGGTESVARFVMNDDLALYAAPDFASAEEMEMQRGDRVHVLATAPVPAQGSVFVQVQVADRAPYPVGWMPLHWLVVAPRTDAPLTLDFEASYGLVSKLVREFIEDTFYDGCDLYPTYAQQAVVSSTPELENPASIPYGERYECGELPVGTVQSSARKHVGTYEFSSPSAYYELAGVPVISIDSIDFAVPVKLYRLPYQTRAAYEVRDMSTGWAQQFGDGSADVVEHSHYQKFAGALVDEMARVHDSDVWFNVTWSPPGSVEPVPGAQAYFNLCWMLPGGRIEGETSALDVDIYSPGAHSHVTGVHWGVVEYAPFRVCTTAALSATPDTAGGPDVLTTGAQPPIRVDLVRASLHDVAVTFVEPVDLYGTFSGWHGPAIAYLLSFVSDLSQHEGVMGLLFSALVEERLEERLASWLHDVVSRLPAAIPDPETEIQSACNRLMPDSYKQPTSRWYPLYQHCVEASQAADVTLFSNAIQNTQSCHHAGTLARANDGSAWTSGSDTHDVYYAPPDGDPIGIDRPYWVRGCEVEAQVDTSVMSGYEELLECAANVMDEGVNFRRSQGWIASQAQQRCLVPAVGLLCELYGEGEDLTAMWSEALGVTPNLDGYTSFCDWYDSLTAPDLPDYSTGQP